LRQPTFWLAGGAYFLIAARLAAYIFAVADSVAKESIPSAAGFLGSGIRAGVFFCFDVPAQSFYS